MIAARKSILLGLAALALLSSLSGCIIAPGRGHFHGSYVAEGPAPQQHWNNNGWQGNGGGNWNHYH